VGVFGQLTGEGGLDFACEQVEIQAGFVGGVEGAEAQAFPPAADVGVQRGDYDRAAGRLGVELDCGSSRNAPCGTRTRPTGLKVALTGVV